LAFALTGVLQVNILMTNFVDQGSIVRKIWANSDTILLIFAGSAAEFALNKAVDWLFFTGKLPADPIGRLFSTVRYAQDIVFSDEQGAYHAIARIHAIHGGVEKQRGFTIPDWAYRDVLYMLIDYSERAFRLLHRPLSEPEKEEVFQTFRRVGSGLQILELPATYTEWLQDRQRHLNRDLQYSSFTAKLHERYKEQLGNWRYDLLRQAQALLVPEPVHQMLHLPARPPLSYALWLYPVLMRLRLRSLVQRTLLPAQYLQEIKQLDQLEAA
jgi:uncharacterized protein (DUF2236 family)